MAAAGLVVLKRRIESIKKTRKITRAMALVATAKLRKCRNLLFSNGLYYDKVSSVFQDLLKEVHKDNLYVNSPKEGKKLYVVFTSDNGLCGGYNNYLVNKTKELCKDKNEKVVLCFIGHRGKGEFESLNYNIMSAPCQLSDISTVEEIKVIVNHLIEAFKRGEASEINLIYTKFITTVKTEVVVEKLLPLEVDRDEATKEYIIFEPSLEEVFEEVVKEYLKERVYYAAILAKSSEHSARMTAMDGATHNANDLLGKLQLKYNRIRQSSITQEISEIVGGSEAQT